MTVHFVDASVLLRAQRFLPSAAGYQRHVAAYESKIGSADTIVARSHACLRHQQPVEWVAMDRRERAHRAGVDVGDRQTLEGEIVQALG